MIAGVGRLDADVSFLEDALGPEKAEAPMQRTPAPGVDVRINPEGYTVSHWGASVSVVSEDVGGARWRNHVHGVTRETEFGSETIVVDGARTEKFLTVTERQGEKTWRWKLATRLVPRLGDDGAVSFLDQENNHVTSLVIDPVQILDRSGKEITPEGLSWELEKTESVWWLTLDLDDAELPLPYVIDPAVTYRNAGATSNTAAGATTLVLTMPTGVVQTGPHRRGRRRPWWYQRHAQHAGRLEPPSQRDQRHDAALRDLLARRNERRAGELHVHLQQQPTRRGRHIALLRHQDLRPRGRERRHEPEHRHNRHRQLDHDHGDKLGRARLLGQRPRLRFHDAGGLDRDVRHAAGER